MKQLRGLKKLICGASLAALVSCAAVPAASGAAQAKSSAVTLDQAITSFSGYLAARLPAKGAAAVVNISSPMSALSDYVSDELLSRLHNDGKVTIVSRQDWDTIKQEQNIQLEGGDVSEETAVHIGYVTGWQTIITGSISPLENSYRVVFRAVDAQTAELRGAQTYMVKPDPALSSIVNPSLTVAKLSRRQEMLKPFEGRTNAFSLRIWPKGDKAVYYDGEEMFINIRAAQDCYFVVYQVDVDDNMQIIYPNDYDRDNSLKANVTRAIPESSSFIFHAPYGEERILVYASEKPIVIPADQYGAKTITAEYLSAPNALWQTAPQTGAKAMSVVPRGATGQFSYTILPGK